MATAEQLREGLEIWVRCRVGKAYDPPNPSLVTLTLAGSKIRGPFARRPSIVAYAQELDWQLGAPAAVEPAL